MRYLILLALLCSSCIVGVLQPTPTATKPALPTLTATDAPEITPTQETDCVPHYWARVWAYTNLYANPDLTVRLIEEGHEVVLHPGDAVLLLESRIDDTQQVWAYRVVTAEGDRVEGWIPFYVLPVECR
jgi:hypothetical protein